MEETLFKIEKYCQDNSIPFKKIEHAQAASAKEYHEILKTKLEQQAKALLLRYKKQGEKGFVVVAIQAQKKVDLEKIKTLQNAKTLRLAELEQLKKETGCGYGELPPLGKIFNLQLFFDKDLLNEKEIYFNAGSLTNSFVVSPQDLFSVEKPILF